jgi:hypothetical protein
MGSRWADYIDPTPLIFTKAVQERWYRNHARAMEDLHVIQLRNGRLGLIGGRVAVSDDQNVLINFCFVNHVTGAQIRRLALPEGLRIHRMRSPDQRSPGRGWSRLLPRL